MVEAITQARPSGPASDTIADWIRAQIRTNRFVPGQRLVEADLTHYTGGSRFKVREALQRLAAEGLIEIEEYRGARVKQATMDEIRQFYRARAALEGICAADFVRLATDADKQQLYDLNEEIEVCVQNQLSEEFGRLNAAWHSLIMQVAGNDLIDELVQRLHTPVHHLQFSSFYRGDRLRGAVEDHRRIIAAIKAGDADGAEKAMRLHVEHGLQFLTDLDKALHRE